jgi:hypothetical protein
MHVRNVAPCFFLNDQNRCEIEVQHGYDAKPETCRLFPFNHLLRAGDYLVVAPHAGALCPLEVVPHDQRSQHSDHTALLTTMAAHGVGVDVPDAIPIVRGVSELIELEKQILTLSESRLECPDYLSFAAEQLAVTDQVFAATERETTAHLHTIADVRRFNQVLCEVLGAGDVESSGQDAMLDRAFVAMTPALRAHLVFPRSRAQYPDLSLDRVPYLLIALHRLTQFARQTGMQRVTLQTVMQLLQQHASFLDMLTMLDRVMVWRTGVVIDLLFQGSAPWRFDYGSIARSLLPKEQSRSQKRLGTVLLEHATSVGVDRIVFLRQLSRHVTGRLMPYESGGAAVGERLRTPKAAVQQWLLGHVDPALLMNLAERRSKGLRTLLSRT